MSKDLLEALPSLPGIYLFKGNNHQVIYIGKAKNLKKRVQSYFTNTHKDWKVAALMGEYATIEHIVTHSEVEALLLEAQLIGQHKPKFNVLLKSGQPFLYLLFTNEAIPRIEIVRTKKKKGAYFGPFLQRTQARSVHRFLVETFKLYLCNKKIEHGCLDYHIGRCAGICLPNFSPDEYITRLELAKKALQKDRAQFLTMIEHAIADHSAAQQYEKAQRLHQYQEDVETIFNTLHVRYSDDKYFPEFFKATNPAPDIAQQYDAAQKELQDVANINTKIETIDCFDISHFQGKHMVGSCIRYTNGVPEKNMFRKFNIKTLDNQNDYAALQEVVSRRYKNKSDMPDLILIDGGKGQRNAIKEIIKDIPIISLAKREERLFSDAYPEGTVLDMHTAIGKLLISLRDYAHHFAINFHRSKRAQRFL